MSTSQSFIMSVSLAGTGHAVPERSYPNAFFEKTLDTSNEWIVQRTGIRERRFAETDETTSAYAVRAARKALEASGLAPEDIGMTVLATSTPDMRIPATANIVQRELGLVNAYSYDISAACSGFVFAMVAANAHIRSGLTSSALVVAADLYSSIIDFEDRNTAVLFGDGAGAAVLVRQEKSEWAPDGRPSGVVAVSLNTDASRWDNLTCVGGGTAARQTWTSADHGFVRMDGRDVFKQAVQACEARIRDVLDASGCKPEHIACLIPHQANIRIIEKVAENVGYPLERMAMNLDRYGNMAAASIPVALDEAVRSGRVGSGDLILLVAAGAGFSSAAMLLRV